MKVILYHYSRKKIDLDTNWIYEDTTNRFDHKPDGLWLSQKGVGNSESWFEIILNSAASDPGNWCHYDVRYETRFRIEFPIPDEIKVISLESEIYDFSQYYGDGRRHTCHQHPRGLHCLPNGKNECSYCSGQHVDWNSVKADYDGMAVSPYYKRLSNKGGNLEYHWNAFDCSSWCFWRLGNLEQMGESTLVADRRLTFGWKCQCCQRRLGSS